MPRTFRCNPISAAKSNSLHAAVSSTVRTECQKHKVTALSSSVSSSSEGEDDQNNSMDSTRTTGSGTINSKSKPSSLRVDKTIHRAQNISPPLQLLILVTLYVLHLTVLTQNAIIFPFQLFPNEQGRFQSIGLDSLAGIISFVTIQLLRNKQLRDNKRSNGKRKVTIPSVWSGVHNYDGVGPWKFPKPSPEKVSPKVTSMVSLGLLISAYFMTGRIAAFVELYLYAMAGMGVPMTIAMHRSLVVLGGHLVWVMVGSGILAFVLRPQPFFGGGNRIYEVDNEGENIQSKSGEEVETSDSLQIDTSSADERGKSKSSSSSNIKKNGSVKTVKQNYRWYTNKLNANWMWWSIGGYFISSWFFNIADFLNQLVLPARAFEMAGEGVVSQLINPENNDIAASLVGYIAPCISAPWWEEVLYRGFLLPALCLQMKFWPAVLVSGIVFSVHHVSTTGAIPLAILGWTWAAMYAKSGNLLVTILIHAMWNSRVFLGSWLGL